MSISSDFLLKKRKKEKKFKNVLPMATLQNVQLDTGAIHVIRLASATTQCEMQ